MTAKAAGAALTVEAAGAAILDGVVPVAGVEHVGLLDAIGRVLAEPVSALLTQPPFAASAMDGYAVRPADVASLPARLRLVGTSAAGHGFRGQVGAGEAVRIFTGAPVPDGTVTIVIQENTRREGDIVHVVDGQPDREHIRPRGGDFATGDLLLAPDRLLTPRDVTLAAAMGHARLPVRCRPKVAILATGDELVLPGQTPKTDQIVCSNPFGVAGLVTAAGGAPDFIGIAGDTLESLVQHLERTRDADVIVTLGGASVGDHDLVGPALRDMGMSLGFWKIAMRPGKPLMYGRLGEQRVLGLPGNPVSSLVTARLFLVPLLRALSGRPHIPDVPTLARTTAALPANGPRAHYMRATRHIGPDGQPEVTPVRAQDSSLLSPLAEADVLLIRPIAANAAAAGELVPVLPLDM